MSERARKAETHVDAAWASEIERRAREARAPADDNDDVAWEIIRAELHAVPMR